MHRSISASPWSNRLDLLPLAEQQRLVNDFFNMHPDTQKWYAKNPHHRLPARWLSYPGLGVTLVSLTPREVIELRPPDLSVKHLPNFTNCPFVPIWVCHGSGKQVFVSTMEEWERELAWPPQCYGPTHAGPWYGSFADPWPYEWEEATKGVFAPAPASYRAQYEHFPPSERDAVFATKGLMYPSYNGRWYSAGQIFLLEDSFEDHVLVERKTVIRVESLKLSKKDEPTGSWFLDPPRLNNYARGYETGDLTGLGFVPLVPARTLKGFGLAVHAPDAPQPSETIIQPGLHAQRKRRRPIKYSDRDYFVRQLGDGIDAWRIFRPGQDPTIEEISHANSMLNEKVWTEGMSPSTLKQRAIDHEINIPEFMLDRPRPSTP